MNTTIWKKARKPIAGLLAIMMLAALGLSAATTAVAQQGADVYGFADLLAPGTGEGGGTGPLGTATFAHTAGGSTVTVIVTGLAAGSKHSVHVHGGSCAGAVLQTLNPLQADASGMSNTVTQLNSTADLNTWFVDVHADDTTSGAGILCGKVKPALAGGTVPQSPPVSTLPPAPGGDIPGMPATGQPYGANLIWIALAGLAGLISVAGLRLRARGDERA